MEAAEAAGVKKVSGELREGPPADVLGALAEEKDVGLIVISGGRGQRYTRNPCHRVSSRGRAALVRQLCCHRPEPGGST